MNQLQQILDQVLAPEGNFVDATLSSPIKKQLALRVKVRPVSLKSGLKYQVSEYSSQQVSHKNITREECQEMFTSKLAGEYRQCLICTQSWDYHILSGKTMTILKKTPSKAVLNLLHDREKQYLIPEGAPAPFLVELGIMDSKGKVFPKKRDKFVQINRFLELLRDAMAGFDLSKIIHIVDFGCGKAYLTFALYHYLVEQRGYALDVCGLDLKKDVIEKCSLLAQKLGYAHLRFQLGSIADFKPIEKVDMVIALHACDTATDAALQQAIDWEAGVILCVPCCQHELFKQIECESLNPLLKHGILKERFAALATDAARAQLLEVAGYQVQVMEFIDLEHTPKNLLIRAVKKALPGNKQKALAAYEQFKTLLSIKYFSLEKP